MDISDRIGRGDPEDEGLEYKDKAVDNKKVALELAALANSGGGVVVLGVRENNDGEPDLIQSIHDIHSRSEAITNVIYDRVEPNLEFEPIELKVDEKTLVAFQVSRSMELHSYLHHKFDEHVFPIRRNTRVGYLHGHEVANHYQNTSEEEPGDKDGFLRLETDDDFSNFFIRAPDGHISSICIFSDIYYPNNPTRVDVQAGKPRKVEGENILATLESIFDLSVGRSRFTINQSNAAWIGKGYKNFVSNLRNRHKRYQDVRDDYELDLYKHEHAILISELGKYYPESVLLLYVAPWLRHGGYRHININFLIDGHPTDVRPLVEFAEQTNLMLSPSQEVEIETDGIKNPSRIPVKIMERSVRKDPIGDTSSVDGAVCLNPFYGELEFLSKNLEINDPGPISGYESIFGYLRDWDNPNDPREYGTKRFLVNDWSFAKGVYATVNEVRFDINW